MIKRLILGILQLSFTTPMFAQLQDDCIQFLVKPDNIIKVYETSIPGQAPLANGVGFSDLNNDPILLINLNQQINGLEKVRVIGPSTMADGIYWVKQSERQEKTLCYDDQVNWLTFDHLLPKEPVLSQRVINVLSKKQKLLDSSGTLLCHGNKKLKNSDSTNLYYAIYARVGHSKHPELQGHVSSALMYLKYFGDKTVTHLSEVKIPGGSSDFEYYDSDDGFETFANVGFSRKDGYLLADLTLKTNPFSNRTQRLEATNCHFLEDRAYPLPLEDLLERGEKSFTCSGSLDNFKYEITGSHRGNTVRSTPAPQITLSDIADNIIYRRTFEETEGGILSSKVFSIVPAFPEAKFSLKYDRQEGILTGNANIKHLINDRFNFVSFEPVELELSCSNY